MEARTLAMGQFTDEEALWNRSLLVTGKPKNNLLASQILNPCYFRDMHRFCEQVAQTISRRSKLATVDEVEGIFRVWADRASFSPQGVIEFELFTLLDSYSASFKGWQPSTEATFIILDTSDSELNAEE